LRYGGEIEKPGYQVEFFVRPQWNLPGGSRNDDLFYGLSRLGAKSDWSLLRFAVSGRKYMGDWSAEVQLSGQYANQPLIAGEQFGAGGVNSVRGFEEREVSGDKGVRYTFQLLAPPISSQKIRTLAFLEGGQTRLEGALPGEIGSESILSTGLGMRWSWSEWFSLKLDWGYVLNGVDDRRPDGTEKGDSRVHFNLFGRF
jgi:hemolysin activation/secretion protein